jgi:GGDEF domain-containing protein
MKPSDLESAVHQQSWEWLFDLSRRLDIGVELIDAGRVPLFSIAPTPAAAELRRGLASETALTAAISDCLRSSSPVSVRVDGMRATCFRMPLDGVLVLAHEAPDEGVAAEVGHDFEVIGSWLAGAVGASLTSPPHTASEEPYRAASLRRSLSDAAASGSARRVMGAFVEALGVWDNVRVRSYGAGADGAFYHFVSPVGAVPSVPDRLDDRLKNPLVPHHGRMVRLSRKDADALGFAGEAGDLLTLSLPANGRPGWLLIFSGAIGGAEQARLTFYADLLREALNDVYHMTVRLVVAAVPQQRPGPNETVDAAVDAALGTLAAAVGGHEAALVMTTVTGKRAFEAGSTHLIAASQHERADRLVVRSSATASVLTVVLSRANLPFTAFDRAVVEAGLAALHPWLQGALLTSPDSERRRQFRPLEEVFDRLAATAVVAGQDASVIVVSVDRAAAVPAVLLRWLAIIRGQLRGGDFAGLLSDHEIAVLLCDASAAQAATVASRISELIQTEPVEGSFVQPTLTATTRSPHLPFEGSLVRAARAGAAATH